MPFLFVMVVAQFALLIKRLHDFDKTGLISLISVLPLFNLLLMIVLALVPGTPGPNRFGDYPNSPPS